MRTVSFLTLGCKVNQYDSQAMLESFLARGYRVASFDDICDVYVINTCTVTGTGDQKSRKAIRQAARRNPSAAIVAAGCLTQRDGEAVGKMPGIRLVLGTSRRGEAAALLEDAIHRGVTINAVDSLKEIQYENISVMANEGRTRAIMKIQDGCDRRCSYCIIPDVRGPVRSRGLSDVRTEAERLAVAGYKELVLTGIHLCSYGRDLKDVNLVDAIRICAEFSARIRLGSLEPSWIMPQTANALAQINSLCGQFHLSLQSGSDAILRLMKRPYTTRAYREAVRLLRTEIPGCAITTDVITGFPGETEENFLETLAFCEEIGFARTHVFPYSERAGTPAASYRDPVPAEIRKSRAQRLIQLSKKLEVDYLRKQIGMIREVLFEENGEGFTREYVRVRTKSDLVDDVRTVKITGCEGDILVGDII